MSGQFWATAERRSRKERPCDWCGERILLGSVYARYSFMADDMPYPEAFNAHLECAQAAEDERVETMNENITWGESHLRGWTGPAMEEAERSITALAGTFAGPRIRRGSLYLFTPNVPEAAP